ncbi:MAG: putative methyltransferase YcgJ [Chlamydiae bacterium]|nr:putative methyltransferase YcgJ [Chlamydiota bacterium]
MTFTKKKILVLSLFLLIIGVGIGYCSPKIYRKIKVRWENKTRLTLGVPIKYQDSLTGKNEQSLTEEYWNAHTVNSIPHTLPEDSLAYLDWRSRQYPLFHELMDHFGKHDNEVVLDYGCGPGNDLVGFLAYTDAQKIIGMDVSKKALRLASHRLSLHRNFDLNRIELIQVEDTTPTIPLSDNSVDFIFCEGVLHHTSYPEKIIKEFNRVLKPNGKAVIMVYNSQSLWKHLYVAYELQVLKKKFSGLSIDEAFTKSTDGEDCPIALNYSPSEFMQLCEEAGFQTVYSGGYFSKMELELYHSLSDKAIADSRLPDDSRRFLKALSKDRRGYPTYNSKPVGVGGVYLLQKSKQ